MLMTICCQKCGKKLLQLSIFVICLTIRVQYPLSLSA